eukprot:2156751-Amphidinium_carterae.2
MKVAPGSRCHTNCRPCPCRVQVSNSSYSQQRAWLQWRPEWPQGAACAPGGRGRPGCRCQRPRP